MTSADELADEVASQFICGPDTYVIEIKFDMAMWFLNNYERIVTALRSIAGLQRELAAEREERQKYQTAFGMKDRAMGILFDRLHAAGVDCSDLIP